MRVAKSMSKVKRKRRRFLIKLKEKRRAKLQKLKAAYQKSKTAAEKEKIRRKILKLSPTYPIDKLA